MAKTEKIQLPDAGQSITVKLESNSFGATSLKIANWKDSRYYFTWYYKTQYNQKQTDLGWIAKDGSDWNIKSGNWETEKIISQVKEQVIT